MPSKKEVNYYKKIVKENPINIEEEQSSEFKFLLEKNIIQ
jgi:hypothetical protein